MPDTQPRLAVVGPGLIGTSIALAAARRWPGLEVRTVDQGEPLETIGDSLVVVLAMPVDVIIQTLPRLGAVMHRQALVLDTGSTKRAVLAAASAARLSQFVGGHPMAAPPRGLLRHGPTCSMAARGSWPIPMLPMRFAAPSSSSRRLAPGRWCSPIKARNTIDSWPRSATCRNWSPVR